MSDDDRRARMFGSARLSAAAAASSAFRPFDDDGDDMSSSAASPRLREADGPGVPFGRGGGAGRGKRRKAPAPRGRKRRQAIDEEAAFGSMDGVDDGDAYSEPQPRLSDELLELYAAYPDKPDADDECYGCSMSDSRALVDVDAIRLIQDAMRSLVSGARRVDVVRAVVHIHDEHVIKRTLREDGTSPYKRWHPHHVYFHLMTPQHNKVDAGHSVYSRILVFSKLFDRISGEMLYTTQQLPDGSTRQSYDNARLADLGQLNSWLNTLYLYKLRDANFSTSSTVDPTRSTSVVARYDSFVRPPGAYLNER